jgi:hypothetical protein
MKTLAQQVAALPSRTGRILRDTFLCSNHVKKGLLVRVGEKTFQQLLRLRCIEPAEPAVGETAEDHVYDEREFPGTTSKLAAPVAKVPHQRPPKPSFAMQGSYAHLQSKK